MLKSVEAIGYSNSSSGPRKPTTARQADPGRIAHPRLIKKQAVGGFAILLARSVIDEALPRNGRSSCRIFSVERVRRRFERRFCATRSRNGRAPADRHPL